MDKVNDDHAPILITRQNGQPVVMMSREDFEAWLAEDRAMLKRINQLIEAIGRGPFTGIGKPEPLKHQLSGCWSRRINEDIGWFTCWKARRRLSCSAVINIV